MSEEKIEEKVIDKSIVSEDELATVAGGKYGWWGTFDGPWLRVCNLQTGWLALRNYPSYNEANEIGQLYNGDLVQVCGSTTTTGYTWVYSERLNRSGWVNSNFIG